MNEPNESEVEISVRETPAPEAPMPEGAESQEPQPALATATTTKPASVEPPSEEPPIVRHDPFAYMRGAPWMNRKLSPSGRAAAFARRELEAFPAIEGRDPNGADLDAIVKRTVDYMVPIFRHEQAADITYDELEKRRAARIAKRRAEVHLTDRPEPNIIKVSGGDVVQGEPGPALAQLGPEARRERIRAGEWSSPTDDADYLKSLEEYRGRKVRLPDGSLVPDPYSPTGYLMSLVEDLKEVARAGRVARQAGLMGVPNTWRHWDVEPAMTAKDRVIAQMRAAIGQGGEFDYQRKAAVGGKDGFVQLRQFRNVSNFNVGLFMQQTGVPLDLTLRIAGRYAREHSSNHRPDKPYGLDPQTREFIEQGHAVGARGVFGW